MFKEIPQLSVRHLDVCGQELVLCQIDLKKGDRIVQDRLAVLALPHIDRVQLLIHLFQLAHTVFHPLCAVVYENIKNVPVILRPHKVSVILDPAYRTVLLDNAVLHIVKIIDAVCDLAFDTLLDLIDIIRVHHSPECISREHTKLLLRIASKYPQYGAVDVQQLLVATRAVDEQPTRHSLQYRSNTG